ncbi:MAG: ATP-dependent zinc metalloprotease FtsH [Planctomycetaceae bacterium]|jgi:cell division protease FtsH|nr:ATP-dependent zinc metalloprotease FtsH [Planctomycetaceae bacterium]
MRLFFSADSGDDSPQPNDNTEVKDSLPDKNQPPRKPFPFVPQKRGGFSFWTISVIVFLGILLTHLTLTPKQCTIPYSELLRLIDQGPNITSKIDVKEGEGKSQIIVRYSNLENIVIGPYEIRGTVTREVIKPVSKKNKKPEEKVDFYSGRFGVNNDNNELENRLEKAGFYNWTGQSYPSFWEFYGSTIFTFLLFLAAIPLIVLIFRKLGGAGAMAFGRNRGRQVSLENVNITFNDVAGVDEAMEELREIVDFLKTPEKFQVLGGRIPKGVLLFGPPGTGKTLLAKAVAGEAGVPFFSLSGSDFVELYVGVGAARVRDLFDQAQRRSPCIIFIDELDAIGKTRGSGSLGSNEERDQTLNALLVEMDGFGTNTGAIVMAATNRPETLDSALLRPGRFDRQVLVDRPDLLGREAILKVHSRNVKLDESINLKQIASITSGFAGADLAALVNEAALLAARVGKNCVTMEEFSEAAERVTAGLQKKRHTIQEDEKKRVAFHESGHALAAYLLPEADTVHKISIIPRGIAALGYTLQRPEDDRYLMTQAELECRIQVLLGGTLAEEMILGTYSTGAQNDLERATDIARSMVMDFGMSRLGRITFRENPRGTFLPEQRMLQARLHSEKTAWEIDQEIRSILETLLEKTRGLLEKHRKALEKLAGTLLEKEVIGTEELTQIVEEVEHLSAEVQNSEPVEISCEDR